MLEKYQIYQYQKLVEFINNYQEMIEVININLRKLSNISISKNRKIYQ